MKKVIDYCKAHYKILIPIMAVIVLIGALIFFYKEYRYDNYRNKKEEHVFQYFAGIRNEYTAIITYNLKNSIVDIKPKDAKIEYDGTPIYYLDSDMVIFPKEMTIVFPLREGSQYKLNKYSTYYKEENLHYIKNNVDVGNYSVFFLYDGNGVYFFPYEVSLNVNKKEIVKLSEMSFVYLTDDSVAYYNYADSESKIINIEGKNVSISSENININLTEKYLISFGKEVLLFGPNKLNPVFKTIDK